MQTHELLFELSHPIRYEIMKCLEEQPLRLTKIGEQVDANNPEVSRHLDRLRGANLVAKGSDGRYHITAVGEILFTILPSISFIAHNQDFIMENDLVSIPASFIARIGELTTGVRETSVLSAVHHSLRVIETAEERLLITTNETNREYQTAIRVKIDEGIGIRSIIGPDFRFPSADQVPTRDMARDTMRLLYALPVMIVASEKEAGVCFRSHQGIFTFFPLFSHDPMFIAWCVDLFNDLWKRSEPLHNHPMLVEGGYDPCEAKDQGMEDGTKGGTGP